MVKRVISAHAAETLLHACLKWHPTFI